MTKVAASLLRELKDKPLSVLHVEDNPLDARLLKTLLAREGQHQIALTQVSRLSDAKQFLLDRHYDVALLDLMLPDEQGISSILSLQANAPFLPIVVYTGLPGLNIARDAILAGAGDYAVKGHTDTITLVHKLYTSVDRHRMKRDLYSQLAVLTLENQQLQNLSYHDPLTCLYNRRGLEQRLSYYLKPGDPQAYVTIVDIDGFRGINERFGHHVGDQVLQEVAQCLVICSQNLTVLARLGGDEFVAVGNGGKSEAMAQGQALRAALKADLNVGRQLSGHALTCCQSISMIGHHNADLSVILEAAQAALAGCKQAGQDQVIGQWAQEPLQN